MESIMWLRFIVTLTCLFVSTVSFAHGTGQHVLGTVTAIDATHIEVKTSKGRTVDVQVNKQTRFKEKGNPKGANLPVVGDRVVIEATKEDKVLLATEIHFSAATRVPAPAQPVPVH
jgi:putative ribosome biogenesis GTPase RsgA